MNFGPENGLLNRGGLIEAKTFRQVYLVGSVKNDLRLIHVLAI